jgi:hypothetical protein
MPSHALDLHRHGHVANAAGLEQREGAPLVITSLIGA